MLSKFLRLLQANRQYVKVGSVALQIDEVIRTVASRFPFDGYMGSQARGAFAYRSIARVAQEYFRPAARVLDFGCGPCDHAAVLQQLGFSCAGYDDLSDPWHLQDGNRERIKQFAALVGVDLRIADGGPIPFEENSFDVVMLNDVLEHMHDSPRELLCDLLKLVVPSGLLLITVPNAVNIRKRLAVLRGRTNLPAYEEFYWQAGPWRGHVREYVLDDLAQLAHYLDLDIVVLRGCDHMLGRVPGWARTAYLGVTSLFPGWKDSLMLLGRKKGNCGPRREGRIANSIVPG